MPLGWILLLQTDAGCDLDVCIGKKLPPEPYVNVIAPPRASARLPRLTVQWLAGRIPHIPARDPNRRVERGGGFPLLVVNESPHE